MRAMTLNKVDISESTMRLFQYTQAPPTSSITGAEGRVVPGVLSVTVSHCYYGNASYPLNILKRKQTTM